MLKQTIELPLVLENTQTDLNRRIKSLKTELKELEGRRQKNEAKIQKFINQHSFPVLNSLY